MHTSNITNKIKKKFNKTSCVELDDFMNTGKLFFSNQQNSRMRILPQDTHSDYYLRVD